MKNRDNIFKALNQLDSLLKHFGPHDTRHPSATHTADLSSQKPHGNRPGFRTQQTILSSMDILPEGFDDANALQQADFFVRATGLSSPVVQVGDRFWLAPPHAKMLPERAAGENLKVDSAPGIVNTNVGSGLDSRDELKLPAPPDSEEGKRFLEAAAEHRNNDYKGPTTPRLEAMFGDMLRSQHPKRDPNNYGARLTPDKQQEVIKELKREQKSKFRLGLPLQKMQAINAFINVFQDGPHDILEQQFISDLLGLMDPQAFSAPGRRSQSTAQGMSPAAQSNANTQRQRAEGQRNQQEQRLNQARADRSSRLRRRLE